MNDEKQLSDYREGLKEASECSVRLLKTLKALDSVCMPAEITVCEIERFTKNIVELISYINKKIGGVNNG